MQGYRRYELPIKNQSTQSLASVSVLHAAWIGGDHLLVSVLGSHRARTGAIGESTDFYDSRVDYELICPGTRWISCFMSAGFRCIPINSELIILKYRSSWVKVIQRADKFRSGMRWRRSTRKVCGEMLQEEYVKSIQRCDSRDIVT